MTESSRRDLPRAVREALATQVDEPNESAQRDEPGLDRAPLDEVPRAEQALSFNEELRMLLEPKPPSSAGHQRLLDAVEIAPTRYAPFFSRLSALFDLEEPVIEQLMARLASPDCWKRTGLVGVSRLEVIPGPRLGSARTSLVHFAPGGYFPHHRHLGFEQVFVMRGSYTDNDGVVHGPGDLHEMQEGTAHEFWIADDEPCIAASVLHRGLRFTRWPQKLFNPFMK